MLLDELLSTYEVWNIVSSDMKQLIKGWIDGYLNEKL